MVGAPLNKFSAFYHFELPIYYENMHFYQNMVENFFFNFFNFLKNSLKCENFVQFYFSSISFEQNKEDSHLRLFLNQESNFWATIHRKWFILTQELLLTPFLILESFCRPIFEF